MNYQISPRVQLHVGGERLAGRVNIIAAEPIVAGNGHADQPTWAWRSGFGGNGATSNAMGWPRLGVPLASRRRVGSCAGTSQADAPSRERWGPQQADEKIDGVHQQAQRDGVTGAHAQRRQQYHEGPFPQTQPPKGYR